MTFFKSWKLMVLKFHKLWNVYFNHGTLFGYKICLTWNQFWLRQFWLRHDLKPGVVTIFAILIIMMAALYSCECVIREKPPNHNENSILWIWRKRIRNHSLSFFLYHYLMRIPIRFMSGFSPLVFQWISSCHSSTARSKEVVVPRDYDYIG